MPASQLAAMPLRVLLIDDDEFTLEFVSDMLNSLGVAEILTASEGRAGLALLDSLDSQPDALICDLNMPGMDGIEFLRHLAESGYDGVIAVLSATDSTLLHAAESLALAHGLNLVGALGKPPQEAALASILNKAGKPRPAPSKQQRHSPLTLTPEELRSGITAGHLTVHFQPKVSVRDRRVLGAECLARWRHPERGLLGPETFVAVAEQQGLIDELTRNVLHLAAQQLAEWLRQGHQLLVSVNVSMFNLHRLDLPEVFDQLVRDAGADPQHIVLEVTESGLSEKFTVSLDILARLRLKGFSLSIDDFGTGYSTLENLSRLPFTELKLDRAFVHGGNRDERGHAILESSARLGKLLRLNLVAEGVENQEDWDLVAALGCDEVQGYFVAKPMPAAELIAWKKRWEDEHK